MRRGYTVVEVVIGLSVLAIGAALTLPALRTARLQRDAREVVTAIRTVEAAALQARGLDLEYSSAPVGEIPSELADLLPSEFTFTRPGFRMGWGHWTLGRSLGPLIEGDAVGTVVVEIRDPSLREAVLRLVRPSLWYRVDVGHPEFLDPDPTPWKSH